MICRHRGEFPTLGTGTFMHIMVLDETDNDKILDSCYLIYNLEGDDFKLNTSHTEYLDLILEYIESNNLKEKLRKAYVNKQL